MICHYINNKQRILVNFSILISKNSMARTMYHPQIVDSFLSEEKAIIIDNRYHRCSITIYYIHLHQNEERGKTSTILYFILVLVAYCSATVKRQL
jgi:hypothetical protein